MTERAFPPGNTGAAEASTGLLSLASFTYLLLEWRGNVNTESSVDYSGLNLDICVCTVLRADLMALHQVGRCPRLGTQASYSLGPTHTQYLHHKAGLVLMI